MFLHVREPERVIAELSARLPVGSEVRAASALFETVGERLAARLADVVVLPAAGREAWLRSSAGVERHFRGHHGGLHPDETRTYLAELRH